MNTGADDESLSTPTFAFKPCSQRAGDDAAAAAIIASALANNIRAPPARQRCFIKFSPPLVTGLWESPDPARERRLVLAIVAVVCPRRFRAGLYCRRAPAPRQRPPLLPSQSRGRRPARLTGRRGSWRRTARRPADYRHAQGSTSDMAIR